MKIIKIDKTLINLSAVEQYSGTIDDVILQKLKDRLENTCDKNTFILKVSEIVRRSKCAQTQSRLDGSADVSVWYKIEALVYNSGDTLVQCEIQNIERSNNILCKYDHAVIKVKGSRIMQRLKKGQNMPIKITKVQYMKGRPKMTIFGTPYTYSFECILYVATLDYGAIPKENIELLDKQIEKIQEELKHHKDKKLIKFFDDIFYPFKSKVPKDPPGFKLTNTLDFIKTLKTKKQKTKMVLMRHPRILKSTPDIYVVEPKVLLQKDGFNNHLMDVKRYKIKQLSESLGMILFRFLEDYLNHLVFLRQMTEVYNTEKSRKDHSNLWNIYKQLKRD